MECMDFPRDWAKFLEDYSFRDHKEFYTNGARLIPTFRVEQMMEHYLRKAVEELEETVVHQRKRADTAETFICTMCSECEWEVHDGILIMQKACCSWFPQCEKFKLRVTDNNVGDKLTPTAEDTNVPSKWIPVTERLPEASDYYLYKAKGIYRGLKNGVGVSYFMHKAKKWQKTNGDFVTHWMPLPEPPKEVE